MNDREAHTGTGTPFNPDARGAYVYGRRNSDCDPGRSTPPGPLSGGLSVVTTVEVPSPHPYPSPP